MGTLYEAYRGGFIFSPEVGVHEYVYEHDFSSLYPNIICTWNVSPDSIRCDCHSDREDVPELGYGICEEKGYLVDVLQPIIDTRDDIKAKIEHESQRDRPNPTSAVHSQRVARSLWKAVESIDFDCRVRNEVTD